MVQALQRRSIRRVGGDVEFPFAAGELQSVRRAAFEGEDAPPVARMPHAQRQARLAQGVLGRVEIPALQRLHLRCTGQRKQDRVGAHGVVQGGVESEFEFAFLAHGGGRKWKKRLI